MNPTNQTEEKWHPPPPKYIITTFILSQNPTENDSLFEIRRYGKCFYITIDPENLLSSPALETMYRGFLDGARNDANGERDERDLVVGEEEEREEAFYEWAMECCVALFEEMAPAPIPDKERKSTLYEFLHSQVFYYTLHAIDGQLVPVESDARSGGLLPPGVELEEAVFSPSWPSFLPSDIELCSTNADDEISGVPSKVLVAGNGMVVAFFKMYQFGEEKIARREVERYRFIAEAGIGDEVRISRILGVVRDEEGKLLGLLLTFIECEYVTLTCAVEISTPFLTKRKRVDQVSSILEKLHEKGIVWGDAKTDNVLVDKGGDAWIIDFGGGYTRGFVEKEMAGTKEGDLQGLEKIIEFVFREIED